MQGPNGIELRQHILLLAAIVGIEHDFFGCTVPIVGDVQEVTIVIE